MTQLVWDKEPVDGRLAHRLHRNIRAHRRAAGRDGNRFDLHDLRTLYAGRFGDEQEVMHVVLTHHYNQAWQHWAYHPVDGWLPIDSHPTEHGGFMAAESHVWELRETLVAREEPGTYVKAGWPVEGGEVVYTIRTRCSGKNNAIAVADSFRSLGMVTSMDVVE